MNRFFKIICFMGGADLKTLEKTPRDRNKFIAIGLSVLVVALLSTCTMWYTIYSITNPPKLTLGLIVVFTIAAVFWGCIIYVIDWGLISTMHKKKSYDWQSGTILVVTTLFRLTVATVISLSVSKPLEVYIFKDYLPLARREMQKEYKERLDAAGIENEKEAEDALAAATDELKGLPKKLNEIYKDDAYLKKYKDKESKLLTEYNELNAINNKDSKLRKRAQDQINTISGEIENIQKRDFITRQDQQRITALTEKMSPYISRRNYYKRRMNSRSGRLRGLRNEINAIEDEIDNRGKKIREDNQKIIDIHTAEVNKRTIHSDSIKKVVGIEHSKTEGVSEVYDKANLINNMIAISHLEKKADDPNASLSEIETAKKIKNTSWIAMIIILLIDISAIIIKLFTKRGSYEEEKERLEANYTIESTSETEAHRQTYPQLAMKKAEMKLALAINQEEIELVTGKIKNKAKLKSDFNIISNELREKSFQNISEVNEELDKSNNLRTKETLERLLDRLNKLYNNTEKKIYEIFNEHLK